MSIRSQEKVEGGEKTRLVVLHQVPVKRVNNIWTVGKEKEDSTKMEDMTRKKDVVMPENMEEGMRGHLREQRKVNNSQEQQDEAVKAMRVEIQEREVAMIRLHTKNVFWNMI